MEPSFSSFIARRIEAKRALTFDISNACAGMLTGVYVLDRMIRSGIVRNGMVVSGEAITYVADTAVNEISERYDSQFASLSVGDSGCAVVLDQAVGDDKIHGIEMLTAAKYADVSVAMPSDKTQGIAMYSDNRRAHSEDRYLLITYALRDNLCARGALSFADEKFDFVIYHQIGTTTIMAIDAVIGRELGAPMPSNLQVVEKYGNTSSTAHFIVLHDHLLNKQIPAGSKLLMIPAASGIVTGFLSVTVSSLKV
ncbi:3-oxoacyl-[acyl-carrier-protein] synthase III C-terminal domain-containing protein [Nocardia terpenica]|uniref:3-oxoacyl-[acyl-carrier-protein] synthase III C-terminal domain-containing protein n=1 Tax=Nocardia terpenica TaxID=455432 RepID=UPI002FE12F4A